MRVRGEDPLSTAADALELLVRRRLGGASAARDHQCGMWPSWIIRCVSPDYLMAARKELGFPNNGSGALA
jgi:hypothetical protein